MSNTIKQAAIVVVITAAVYLLSGLIIGYTHYDMYLRAIEFLATIIAGGCYWIGSNESK